jgi:hypothetical protein
MSQNIFWNDILQTSLPSSLAANFHPKQYLTKLKPVSNDVEFQKLLWYSKIRLIATFNKQVEKIIWIKLVLLWMDKCLDIFYFNRIFMVHDNWYLNTWRDNEFSVIIIIIISSGLGIKWEMSFPDRGSFISHSQ